MTFPIVEIFCPECKERMTLVNKPELKKAIDVKRKIFYDGYDEMVDYHYLCNSNERHIGFWHDFDGKIVPKDDNNPHISRASNWCTISRDKDIVLMRILIPDLGVSKMSDSGVVADTNGSHVPNMVITPNLPPIGNKLNGYVLREY